MFTLNKSQKKYLSDQCAVVGSIILASFVITGFTADQRFDAQNFVISLGTTLAFYTAGVLLRHKLDE